MRKLIVYILSKIGLKNLIINIINYCIDLKNKIFLTEEEKVIVKKTKDFYNFYKLFIKPNDICFDIGANIGNRIQPILKCKAKIIAIEPQPICVEHLKKRFRQNVIILECGIGAEISEKPFYISNANTLSSFSKDWIDEVKLSKFSTYRWEEPVIIKITTIDKLIETYGIPKFCKIDVEGYEYEVLCGLNQTIPIMCFEYTIPEQFEKLKLCLNRVNQINNQYYFNYCKAENTQFELTRWLKYSDFFELIQNQQFIDSAGWGDIYVSTQNLNIL